MEETTNIKKVEWVEASTDRQYEGLVDIRIDALFDIQIFMNVYDEGIPDSIPGLNEDQQRALASLSDEEYNKGFNERHQEKPAAFHLAQNNSDFEMLLMQHYTMYNKGIESNDDDIDIDIEGFILDNELLKVQRRIDLIDTHWGVGDHDTDHYKAAKKYRRYLLKKSGQAIQSKKKSNVPTPNQKLREERAKYNLWDNCIEPSAKDYIKEQVDADRHEWNGHPILYMVLWDELNDKKYIVKECSKLKKTDILKILQNTFPDQELKHGIAKELNRNANFGFLLNGDCISTKIPSFEGFNKARKEYEYFYSDVKPSMKIGFHDFSHTKFELRDPIPKPTPKVIKTKD